MARSRLVSLASFVTLLSSSTSVANAQNATSILDFVDPLIGTINGGHVFAGASLPFSMAKAVADTNGGELQGGYASDDSNITGFSHMHDSGTGGVSWFFFLRFVPAFQWDSLFDFPALSKYDVLIKSYEQSPSLGNFPIFAQSGCPDDELNDCLFTKTDRATPRINSSVEATPGYFALNLTSNVRAEMTVTNHTALYRFTFPETPAERNATLSPLILADLSDLPDSRINGSVYVDEDTGRISGTGTFSPSFGIGSYTLHFCADFSGGEIRDTGVFMNNRAGSQPKNLTVVQDGINNSPAILPAGAWTRFHASTEILARVGVSFISVDQACSNAEREIPDFDFDGVHTAARQAWTDNLGVVSVKPGGVNESLQTVFWSGLYRAALSPQDYTGENPLWESDEPYYDSYYCIWDSFRSIHSLITLVDPISQACMIRSLIEIYRQEGWLPDCRMSLCKGFTQGGSNADVVLTDSYLKGLTDGIDWETGFEALLKDAEVEPGNWAVEGRGGLKSWKELNFIPTDDYDPYGVGPFTRSISRTVEYAYDDFCVAEMARGLGKQGEYEKYVQRAEYWR
jgi:predicted alpha-1,2-mannosidase